MRIIKLNAIDSTNSYLRKLCANDLVSDYTAVMAKKQTQGRGQMGTIWSSQTAKNLTFSVYKDISRYNIEYPFYISIVVSLAVLKSLQFFSVTKLSVKWPNDILSENKKLCGILIENTLKQSTFSESFIGIGLNVNQTDFKNLPQASSLKLITGAVFDLDEVAQLIIKNLIHYFEILENKDFDVLKNEYESFLFRKNKPSTFKDAEGNVFSGFIKNVSETGSLRVLVEDNIVKEFEFKTITLLY